MTPERWEKLQSVFEAARARVSGSERDRLLDDLCGPDAALREEVESLLRADADTGRGETPAAWTGRWLAAQREPGPSSMRSPAEAIPELAIDPAVPGARVGPYRILREIGVGGMGKVYLGERDDDQFRQVVALKLARRDGAAPDLYARFLRERQILANLNHPNIARLLDGGVSRDGQPYFAMEYVEGTTIDRYCDDLRLDVTARLRLFLEVCEGVEHAHRNLVIHRDLKPSNILVTREGRVRLLDFGIARILDEGGAREHGEQTLFWATPAYASPEQIARRPVTTASDVYSMGVLLYELLSGHPPYEVAGASAAEAERIIAEAIPARPSSTCARPRGAAAGDGAVAARSSEEVSAARGTRPQALCRKLKGDLDTIVLQALQKDPERRYPSVAHLADDIQRHLEGRPVRARADSRAYRARKFVLRHRVALSAALLVLLSLLAGLAGTAWQARIAARERDRARIAAAKAERISDFLGGMLSSVDPEENPERDVTVREILDQAASNAGALADQPEVQGAVRATIGRTYMNLGLYPQAREQLEAALATRRQALGEEHAEVSESLDDLANLHVRLGDYARAERLFRDALEATRRALGADHPDAITAANNLAAVLQYQGRSEDAEQVFRELVERFRAALGPNHPSTAAAMTNLAMCVEALGRRSEAESWLREAVRIYRVQAEPTMPLARAESNLALLLHSVGKDGEAESLARESLEIRRRILGDSHPDLARGLHNLALLLRDQGRSAESESLLGQARRIYETADLSGHPDYGATLQGIGVHLLARGESAPAEALLRRAVEIHRQAFSAGDLRRAMTESALGEALVTEGKLGEAEELLERSDPVIQQAPGAPAAQRRQSLRRLILLYEAKGEREKAAAGRKRLAEMPPEPASRIQALP